MERHRHGEHFNGGTDCRATDDHNHLTIVQYVMLDLILAHHTPQMGQCTSRPHLGEVHARRWLYFSYSTVDTVTKLKECVP
jgi:hypothetical protein